MKRYLAFACPRYYPSGGMQDCVGAFDEIDDAKIALCKADYGGFKDSLSHGHIFDLEKGELVFGYDNDTEMPTEVTGKDLRDWLEVDFN